MEKIAIGAKTFLYPMPVILVGANIGGKANYLTVAYCGIVQHVPAMIEVTLTRTHHTCGGIRENGTFSVNIPSETMAQATDYCGIASGRDTDKSVLFETFYGKLETAPMIRQCPLNLECRLADTLDYGGTNEVFIGEIVEVYAAEEYLTDGLPDIRKIKPIIFSMHDNTYWKVGEYLGRAWDLGKKLR